VAFGYAAARRINLDELLELKDRRVLVVGLGRSGLAASRFLLGRGARVTATDMRPASTLGAGAAALADAGVRLACGGHDAGDFLAAELIVVSPGVRPDLPALSAARREGIPVVAEVELASWYVRGHLLGLTGSNGKSTTTALLARMLAEAGRDAVACGNIGLPLLEAMAGDHDRRWYAVELSSFQLETTERLHAEVAGLLNIQPDHLDRHRDLQEYRAAKARLFATQTAVDTAVLNADDELTAELAPSMHGRLATFSLEGPVRRGAYLDDERLVLADDGGTEPLMDVSEVPLAGRHNLANVLAAAAMARAAGVEPDAIRAAVRSFRPLPHRLATVGTVGGVTFVDDSKATNVDAARVAITAFPGKRVVALLGGRAKQTDFAALAAALREAGAVAVAYGEAGPALEEALRGRVDVSRADDLPGAFKRAAAMANAGDVVLLAPACASFDAYRDFNERGDHFAQLVRDLAEEGDQA
jgi:UDP-N-acetylmuramoylalanine--D-glutamate ligase